MTLRAVPDQNLASWVTGELRDAIQRGELVAGERLVERKLAERLGVSHIPVREALAKLAEEGLVERLPRRGARVAVLSAEDLEELSSLRTLLEQFVVVRVQQRWDDRIEARLRKLVASMVVAAERGDQARVFDLDRRFHEQLWELAEHRLLMGLAAQLRSRINGFLWAATSALEPDDRVAHATSHADLVDAIASGDPRRARRAMADHISTAAKRIDTSSADDQPS
ncbi:MAG: GntR family transcriptional regulator [Nocardioidaceae bacterium]